MKVVLGNNAHLRRGERPNSSVQRGDVAKAAPDLAKLVTKHELVRLGGGGPVMPAPAGLFGVPAVVGKDHVAALIAPALGADLLILLTDVTYVMTDSGTPRQRLIRDTTASDPRETAFPAGSMSPKVTAACRFVQDAGGHAAIGSPSEAHDVVSGWTDIQVSRW